MTRYLWFAVWRLQEIYCDSIVTILNGRCNGVVAALRELDLYLPTDRPTLVNPSASSRELATPTDFYFVYDGCV